MDRISNGSNVCFYPDNQLCNENKAIFSILELVYMNDFSFSIFAHRVFFCFSHFSHIFYIVILPVGENNECFFALPSDLQNSFVFFILHV